MADRFDEILVEMRQERADWNARMDRMQAQTDENLRFLRELHRRSEVVLQELLRSSAAMRAEIRESVQEIKQNTESMKAVVAETRANTETTKAHTRAIFALIDRLERGNGGLAPAG